MDKKEYSRPVSLRRVQVTDAFWKQKMELVRKEVIPYQWEALNDRVPDAEPSYCMHNFRAAGKLNARRRELGEAYVPEKRPLVSGCHPEDRNHMEDDRFYGNVFQDSDFFKWIEAAAYSLTQHPDSELEGTVDEAIDAVCAAQLENGYLDTYYIINDMDYVFTNLRDNHELYCFGHLTEAAVAYCQATGKDKLLQAAMRYADYIGSCFGPEEGKRKGYPGHELAELALVRLYEQTGDGKYLELSRFFIEQRGTRPYYYDEEHPETVEKGKEGEIRHWYHQAHLPVREQKEAVGHAVRAVYLYSGMADVARLTGDDSLYRACVALWENITEKKMYITGGIGANSMGEIFSFDYDLPNDAAYAESCAAIGLVFFARRMLEIKAQSQYADVMERALYNGILSGIALDGKSFFYVNPLECLPEACYKDSRKRHVKPVRQKWFGCACCPPNIARTLSSIASYACTESEDTLYVHLYIGCVLEKEFAGGKVEIRMTSGFPWDGKVALEVRAQEETEFTIALRIPGWCNAYTIDGEAGCLEGEAIRDGYLYVKRVWKDGERLELEFPMEVRVMAADARVREDIGKVAVTRGPIVYCMEEADNGGNLHLYRLGTDPEPVAHRRKIGGVSVMGVTTRALRRKTRSGGEASCGNGLYTEYKKPEYEETTVEWIPYYAWANRGEGEMQVFIRAE